jgi:hypothetical protein
MKSEHGLLGGVSFLEITLNSQTRLWHAHLHVLFEGQYVPISWLRDTWLKITGDSYIVDIRPVKNADYAAGYIGKYASKAIDNRVIDDHERFVEAILALQATRTFACFGSWVHLGLSKHPETAEGWSPVRPLYLVILDAQRGDDVARSILRYLLPSGTDDPLTLFSVDSG